MISRLGARLLTGPPAFLLGGLLDVSTLVLLSWRDRLRRRRGRRGRRGRRTKGQPHRDR